MGNFSSGSHLEDFAAASSREAVIICHNDSNNDDLDQFGLYRVLSRMGFDIALILKACDKYKEPEQLEKAIDFVLSQKKSIFVSPKNQRCSSTISNDSNNDDILHKNTETEIDEDGYYKLVTNIDDEEYTLKKQHSSSLINDETIKFHLELHKESIEEQNIINKLAEEYEQKRIYQEMLEKEEQEQIQKCLREIQQNLQLLQSSFYAQCQFLHQQYQLKIMGNNNNNNNNGNNGNLECIQNEFHREIVRLKEGYLKQKEFLDQNKYELQELFDSYNDKYNVYDDDENEVTDLRDLNINDVPEYIPSSMIEKNNDH